MRILLISSQIWKTLRRASQNARTKFSQFIQKHPFPTFLGLLALLIVITAIGHQLRKPTPDATPALPPVKEVDLFAVGEVPRVQLQAKVEKSGVVTITAQSAGVVQKIRVKEGSHVKRGSQLFSLSTNYQGGNISDASRQINQKNYQFLVDNYDTQKNAIDRQREVAETSEAQAAQLRDITRQSFDETNTLINSNQTILDGLNKQINQLQAMNVNGSSDSAILQLQQSAAGTTASLNAARTALRANQYAGNNDEEPAQLARLARDLSLTQLDLQQRTLDLNKDLSQLNLQISQITASLMYPASPFVGTIERILVKVGQSVMPGTPLAELRGDKNSATLVILVSADIANNISRFEPTEFFIQNQVVKVLPRSISQEPTDGALHAVIYHLPAEYAEAVTNGSFVTASVPIGINFAKANDPFVPLDAVYQTQDRAYVLLAQEENGQLVARSREVKLGQVYGAYLNVLEGINPGEKIIINRNVIEGDQVQVQ